MKHIVLAITLFLLVTVAPLHAAKVDINNADAQTLEENLEGIGAVKAKAIIDYRRKHGNFKTLDDLTQVPGIGEATVEKNRGNLSLKSSKSKTNNKKVSKKKDDKQ